MSKDEVITLNYAIRLPIYAVEKPYQVLSQIPGLAKTNIQFEPAPEAERIQDLRGQEHLYHIDTHGFQIIEHHSNVQDWTDKQAIEDQYLPEVRQAIFTHLDQVDEVHLFNWRTRKNKPYKEEGIQTVDLQNGSHYSLPANWVHIDQSPTAAFQEVKLRMGDRAEELLQGRVRVVNFWRPIAPYPIQDAPFAICDGTSLSDDDLLIADHIRRNHYSEAMMPIYRPGYRWHYLSDQKAHECFLFKNFDSLEGVKAKYCPHTSFRHRDIPSGCPPRQSIEVRALVFTYASKE